VNGPPENPTDLVLELADSGEEAVISKDKPFKRVDGYTVDLKYDLEKKTWNNQRVNSALRFGNEDYIIVAITKNEIVVLAKSNQKKTPILIP
jgi:ribosome maturation factor RimP